MARSTRWSGAIGALPPPDADRLHVVVVIAPPLAAQRVGRDARLGVLTPGGPVATARAAESTLIASRRRPARA
jgi:hypothetical protein